MPVVDRFDDSTITSTLPAKLRGRRWRRIRTNRGRAGYACATGREIDGSYGSAHVFTHEKTFTETNEFGELIKVRVVHWEWGTRLPQGEKIEAYLDWAAPPKPGRKATFLHTS